VENLERSKLALLPFFVGLALLSYSWYTSYPLSIEFPGDFVFNHISIFYWLSLPLVLGSLYVLGVFSKSRSLKCAVSVAIIVAIYSLSFFYYSMPTADSQLFRPLTEYFIKTGNLGTFQLNHFYFQWPSYFFLADIVTSVSGLELIYFEFLFYAIIGVLLTATLYVYASRLFKDGALLGVISFFISMYYFLNFQSCPFSFALALTFVLFMLETRKKSAPLIVSMLAIFFCVSFTHYFVALFFILYLIFRSLINRSKQYATLSFLTLTVYLVTQTTLASWNWIELTVRGFLTWSPEYGSIAQTTLNTPVSMPIDVIAQTVSRTLTIAVVLVCIIGCAFMLKRRKLRAIDWAIFLSSFAWFAIGAVLYSLGSRAIPMFFIPVSLGAACLFETRFRSYLKGLFLVLLILFVFVPIHNSYYSFSNSFVPFQTKEASNAEHFLMDHYDWTNPSLILAHSPVRVYLLSSLDTKQTEATFEDEFSPLFPRLKEYDCILYTVGLGNSFSRYNYTIEVIAYEGKLNVVYNNGFSEIATKGSHFASVTP